MPERVVFLDETSDKTNLTRTRGRSLRGTRLTASAPFGSWGTQTLIAGLGASDLIAPWIIKGAMDGPAFVAYIREVLIPEIEPGTVVILDNLATHRNKEAEAALRAHGCWFVFGENRPLDAFLVPQTLAALQSGPEPDRNGLLQTESPPPSHRCTNLHRPLRRPQRNLRPLHAAGMLELLLRGRICFYVNWNCSNSRVVPSA